METSKRKDDEELNRICDENDRQCTNIDALVAKAKTLAAAAQPTVAEIAKLQNLKTIGRKRLKEIKQELKELEAAKAEVDVNARKIDQRLAIMPIPVCFSGGFHLDKP